MIAEQAELNLRRKAAKAVNKDSVEEFCQLLRGRGGWMTARDVRRLRPLWTERFIRLLASASAGRVVSGPGLPGYMLTSEAAGEVLEHAANALVAQGKLMEESGIAYRRILALRRKTEELQGETIERLTFNVKRSTFNGAEAGSRGGAENAEGEL